MLKKFLFFFIFFAIYGCYQTTNDINLSTKPTTNNPQIIPNNQSVLPNIQ